MEGLGEILNVDCLEGMKQLPDNSVDSVVTDAPYGLNFMGKKWDYDIPSVEIWMEAFRVLKPGGYLLCFGGTRTYHRMAVNIEDAGFEIRDCIMWIYGSGFPKSHNISKAIDDINGAEQWEGWGTALKPANEPICVARKPLEKGLTVAENVLKWGTGGLNIDGCRIGCDSRPLREVAELNPDVEYQGNSLEGRLDGTLKTSKAVGETSQGRWPANIIFDEAAAELLDQQTGTLTSGSSNGFSGPFKANVYGKYARNEIKPDSLYSDSGGASRFFYCAKASKSERNKGLEGLKTEKRDSVRTHGQAGTDNPFNRGAVQTVNFHPTVKPVSLMQHLVRLVTPKGGRCLDPFAGSGTTGIACKLEGLNYVLIEREPDYVEIAKSRIESWEIELPEPTNQLSMF